MEYLVYGEIFDGQAPRAVVELSAVPLISPPNAVGRLIAVLHLEGYCVNGCGQDAVNQSN